MLRKSELKARLVLVFLIFFAFIYLGFTQVNYINCIQKKKILKTRSIANNELISDSNLKDSDETSNLKLFQPTLDSRQKVRALTTLVSSLPKDEEVTEKLGSLTNASTQEMSCKEIRSLMSEQKISLTEFRKQNNLGNRGVYFVTARGADNKVIDVVVKIATLPKNRSRDAYIYRYKTALKEIRVLRKLRDLNWFGVPKLYGACVAPNEIMYAVSRVKGTPLCSGVGANSTCLVVRELNSYILHTSKPTLATLTFLSKLTCFFHQFERDSVFMEDLTGSNLFYSQETFDFYVVDADSLIFYGDTPINSGMSCKNDKECRGFSGNFWDHASLNRKIYFYCQEYKGNCVDYVCGGFTSSFQVCGVGRWLVSTLYRSVPRSSLPKFNEIKKCMTALRPEDRCTFETACKAFSSELASYQKYLNGKAA